MRKAVKISPQYLAGFIDGEGCISIRMSKATRSLEKRPYPTLTITNTNFEVLRLIQEGYGGRLYLQKRPSKSNWKLRGDLLWSAQMLVPVLEAVLPYLVIKRRQADLVLELQRMRRVKGRFIMIPNGDARMPNRKRMMVPPDERLIEDAIAANVYHLNKKGSA